MKNRIATLLILCFSLVYLSGCAVEDTSLVDLGEAKVRIINASPDESIINVTINDTVRTPQLLAFSQISSYQKLAAGNKVIATNVNTALVENSRLNLLFRNNKNYSVFIAGKISKDSLVYITLEDNFVGVNDTTARVRFVNASPNSTNLEAVFSTILNDSTANFASTAYRSSTVYQAFRPGKYNIRVRTSRATPNLAVGSTFNIVANKHYTIWIKGLSNETGAYALSPVLLTDN